MPKQSPIPDAVDKPFWDACNEERLVLQYCGACDLFQHPPKPACPQCGADDHVSWREIEGLGTIHSYAVVYDTAIAVLQPDLPFNCAMIELDAAPGLFMISHLPGTPVDEVPIGAKVRLTFEVTPGTGQKVPEWQVAG